MGARQEKEVSLSERGPRRETSLPLFHAPRFVPTLFPLRELAPAVTYFAFNFLQTLLTRSLSHLSTSSPPHWLLFFKNPPSLALVFEISLDSKKKVQERERTSIETTSRLGREREEMSPEEYIYWDFWDLAPRIVHFSGERGDYYKKWYLRIRFKFDSSKRCAAGGKKIVSLLTDLFDLYSKRNRLVPSSTRWRIKVCRKFNFSRL